MYGNVLQHYREAKNKGVKEKVDEPKKNGAEKKAEKKRGAKSKSSKGTKKSEAKEDLSDTPLKR